MGKPIGGTGSTIFAWVGFQLFVGFARNPIDATVRVTQPLIRSVLQFRWDPFWMFDDGAIHVDDIDITAGAFVKIDRPKPRIVTCQPLAFGSFVGNLRKTAFSQDGTALHERTGWFACERGGKGCIRKMSAMRHEQSAGSRKLACMQIGSRPGVYQRVDRRCCVAWRHIVKRRGDS